MKILAFLYLVFCLLACKTHEVKENNQQFMDHLKVDSDVLEVKERCAVLIVPDSVAEVKGIEKIKKEYGEQGIIEMASDEGFYRAEAAKFCESKGLKWITTDKKAVLFVSEDGKKTRVENTQEAISSTLYLFDPKKQPQKIESIAGFSDGKDFENYFNSK